jgi:hypothetical protein
VNQPQTPLAGLLLVVAAGCSSSAPLEELPPDGGFLATPFMTLKSAKGDLSVELRSWPQPPAQGINSGELTVTQVDGGAPVDGLTVSIQPWMPAMDHGGTYPTVTAADGGRYVITNLDLYMPGLWQLRTNLVGPTQDNVAPEFEVP